MDDMAAYYPPPAGYSATHHPYYQPPPPPIAVVAPPPPPPPGAAPPLQHHQPYDYVPHQPPPYAPYGAPPLPHASHDEVRTLFIAGLPEDIKHREIYNLFREFPGYESSQLRTPTQNSQWQPFAFATFLDQQSAVGALHALNGMVFDLEKGSTLFVDFAKSNSKSKRPRTDGERFGSDKKAKGSHAYPRVTPDSGFGSVHIPGTGNTAYSTIAYPSTQSYGNFDGRANIEPAAAKFNHSSAHHMPQNGTPCPTLFVACLGPTCTEQELIQVFSRCPGFLKLKMQSTYGPPVAFVDFQDTACSTGALNQLQGALLYSSQPGEGMRLEFAKSRMGNRRKPK